MLSTCFLQEASAEPASSSGLAAGSAVGSALALALADFFALAGEASAEPEVSASTTTNTEAINAQRMLQRIARREEKGRQAGGCLPPRTRRAIPSRDARRWVRSRSCTSGARFALATPREERSLNRDIFCGSWCLRDRSGLGGGNT